MLKWGIILLVLISLNSFVQANLHLPPSFKDTQTTKSDIGTYFNGTDFVSWLLENASNNTDKSSLESDLGEHDAKEPPHQSFKSELLKAGSVDNKSSTALRIYNGNPASLRNIPFIVRVNLFRTRTRFLCGGSILSEHWVVTAAHCVVDVLQYQGSNHTVTAHGYQVQVTAGDVSVYEKEPSSVYRTVSQVFIHETYNNRFLRSDIALLYLEDPINLDTPYIQKINLATVQPPAGSTVTIAGWGAVKEDKTAAVLQFASYSVPDQTQCYNIFRSNGYFILPGMLCTGNDEMKIRSGKGDSGGPVYVDHGGGNITLLGLVSWGVVDSEVGLYDYDINTDVAYFRDWILDTMKSLKDFRTPLSAKIQPRWMFWKADEESYRYHIFNITADPGSFIKVNFVTVYLSSDYSHVTVRNGNQHTSPLLLQLHQGLQIGTAVNVTSSSNQLLILIRTTGSTNKKIVRFEFSSVATPPTPSPLCQTIMTICSDHLRCFDSQYRCDVNEIPDCGDWSDEAVCEGRPNSAVGLRMGGRISHGLRVLVVVVGVMWIM